MHRLDVQRGKNHLQPLSSSMSQTGQVWPRSDWMASRPALTTIKSWFLRDLICAVDRTIHPQYCLIPLKSKLQKHAKHSPFRSLARSPAFSHSCRSREGGKIREPTATTSRCKQPHK